jgi:energy-coupling factor transporter ATP-binding protein EcfA2
VLTSFPSSRNTDAPAKDSNAEEARGLAMSPSAFPMLIVAGPSGAGKSTLIESLKRNSMAPELRSLLPEAASQWPVFEGNDFLKRSIDIDSVARDASAAGGLILHFDTAFGRRLGITDYELDPAFGVIQRASTLVIISIHPAPETLRSQFERRQGDQRRRRGWMREAWRQIVHRPLRGLIRRASGKQMVDTSRIFRKPGDLEQCYRDWSVFARSLVSAKPGSKLIWLEPQVDDAGTATFAVSTNAEDVRS